MGNINYRAKTGLEIKILNRQGENMLDKCIYLPFLLSSYIHIHSFKECATELCLNVKPDIGSTNTKHKVLYTN